MDIAVCPLDKSGEPYWLNTDIVGQNEYDQWGRSGITKLFQSCDSYTDIYWAMLCDGVNAKQRYGMIKLTGSPSQIPAPKASFQVY